MNWTQKCKHTVAEPIIPIFVDMHIWKTFVPLPAKIVYAKSLLLLGKDNIRN